MITSSFGRWSRLAFGPKVSSEIFQHKLNEALEGLEGVFSVVDDVVIAGCGETMDDAQVHNQQKLTETLRRCAEKNIVLNEDKQQTSLTQIAFHGHRITKDGVKVDEAKVQAIRDMPVDVAGVRRLCGMTQYMSDMEGHSIPVVHRMRERFCHSKEKPFRITMPSLF